MYKELYKTLIDNSKKENRMKNQETYYDRHHIVPDFLFKNRKRTGPKGHLDGDPDAFENIVLLTFQEHLLAHYYLYEIYKESRYEYAAGSALQFFFVKATGNHKRQRELAEVDEKFLNEMEHLRLLGNECISRARKGMMPVVDAVTRESKGSVPTNHPNVLSGEWIHHSKGKKQTWEPQSQKGSLNNNFKELTEERKARLWKCVANSCQDGFLKKKILIDAINLEFNEFRKLSDKWIINNYGSIDCLVQETNTALNLHIKYDPYHRSSEQKKMNSVQSAKHRWYNNGKHNVRVTDVDTFIKDHPEYTLGKIKI